MFLIAIITFNIFVQYYVNSDVVPEDCAEYWGWTRREDEGMSGVEHIKWLKDTYLLVQYLIWRLHESTITIHENCAQQPDFLHSVGSLGNLDPVTHIERMFDEQEDDTCEDFSQAAADEPTET